MAELSTTIVYSMVPRIILLIYTYRQRGTLDTWILRRIWGRHEANLAMNA